jgi:hypothetical protein
MKLNLRDAPPFNTKINTTKPWQLWAQIILFLEMLKFLENYFFLKEKQVCEGK